MKGKVIERKFDDKTMKTYVLIIVLMLILAGILYLGFFNETPKKQSRSDHIYLGALYNGPYEKVTSLNATLSFHGESNLRDIQYYVVMSIWDSNDSYDQIGISSVDGLFFSTYSYTYIENKTIHYKFNATWFPISPGTHELRMTISNGYVTFSVDDRSIRLFTGGNYFILYKSVQFLNGEYIDFTLYEEIYKFHGSLPQISFNFSKVEYNGETQVNDMIPLLQNTSNFSNTIMIIGNTVNLYNQNPLFLKVKILSSSGRGQISIADVQESVLPNKTYILPLLRGNYTLTVNFQDNLVNYTNTYKLYLYKNLYINDTVPS